MEVRLRFFSPCASILLVPSRSRLLLQYICLTITKGDKCIHLWIVKEKNIRTNKNWNLKKIFWYVYWTKRIQICPWNKKIQICLWNKNNPDFSIDKKNPDLSMEQTESWFVLGKISIIFYTFGANLILIFP